MKNTCLLTLVVGCCIFSVSPSVIPPATSAGCLFNGKTYPVGNFQPSPCQRCVCEKGVQHVCVIEDCFFVPCVNPVHDPTICCPSCPDGPNCLFGNITISADNVFHPDDRTTCRCPDAPHAGQAVCSIQQKTTCTHEGKEIPNGETILTNPCQPCTCFDGHLSCAILDCAFNMCVDPVHSPDYCCPSCPNGPNCHYGSKVIPGNQDYHPNAHTTCRCQMGRRDALCKTTAHAITQHGKTTTQPW